MPHHVLTLIAAGGLGDVATEIARQLGGEVAWLAPDRAADVFFDDDPTAAEELARRLDGAVDAVIQPLAVRRKSLLVADMESTTIQNELLDEMADLIGLGERVAEITHRTMNGELDFAASLKARVALFAGQPKMLLAQASKRIRFTPGAATLVRTMRQHGAHTVLVSGGFRTFSSEVGDALGFERNYANELVVDRSTITGAVREPILDAAGKAVVLRRSADEFGVPMARTLAVGDGANDLPMLEAAGIGVAFHAKPQVQAHIPHRVDHGDLTALLYLQGYRLIDFAT
jgi:phosphoserine phosphatase